MRIKDLKNMFTAETNFYLEVVDYSESDYESDDYLVMNITNLLFGCEAFCGMEIPPNSLATEANEVFVCMDMPVAVFNAWKKYSDDYYNKK